jgi:hypothetical protein
MAKLLPLSSMESTLKYQQVESSNFFKQESEAIFELPGRNKKQSLNFQQEPDAIFQLAART